MKFLPLLLVTPLVTLSQEMIEKRELISIHDLTSGETISPQSRLRFSQVKTSAGTSFFFFSYFHLTQKTEMLHTFHQSIWNSQHSHNTLSLLQNTISFRFFLKRSSKPRMREGRVHGRDQKVQRRCVQR